MSCVQNKYSEAKLLFTDGKAQFEKIGDQHGAAQCLLGLAKSFHMQNEYSVEKLLLTDAKTQFEKIGNQRGGAQCLQSLQSLQSHSASGPNS